MKKMAKLVIGGLFCLVLSARAGENLCVNGDLEDPEDPFKGWTIDWDWTGNHYNKDNKKMVELVKKDGLKHNVLKIGKEDGKENCFMAPLVKYEYGKRYRVSFDFRSEQAKSCRIYVKGFKWKSGIRPYENPHPGDLQLLYRGNAITANGKKDTGSETGSRTSSSWTRVTTYFPLKEFNDLSPAAKKRLKYVRYMGLYFVKELVDYHPETTHFYIDNVVFEEM